MLQWTRDLEDGKYEGYGDRTLTCPRCGGMNSLTTRHRVRLIRAMAEAASTNHYVGVRVHCHDGSWNFLTRTPFSLRWEWKNECNNHKKLAEHMKTLWSITRDRARSVSGNRP